jgi:hypothetical protein
MSIANLLVPNNYNLYANTITSTINGEFVGQLINDGLTPDSTRPAINPGPQDYMIRAYDSVGGPTSAQGFLRLAAGGGTLDTDQSGIDIAGSSNDSLLNKTIQFYTTGTPRVKIDSTGLRIVNESLVAGGYLSTGINYYDEFLGNVTYTGNALAAPIVISGGLKIFRQNTKVDIYLTAMGANVGALPNLVGGGLITVAIPSRFAPQISINNKTGLIPVINNSAAVVGYINISQFSPNNLIIGPGAGSGTFSAGPGGLVEDIHFSYYLN